MGGQFAGQPAASARDADRIDVFAIDSSGLVKHRFWDGTRWVAWQAVGGAPAQARAVACLWSGPRLDLFVWGADGALWYRNLAG